MNGLHSFEIICTFAGVMNRKFANIHTLQCGEVQGKNAFFATFSAFRLVVCNILLHTHRRIANYIIMYARVKCVVNMIYKEFR